MGLFSDFNNDGIEDDFELFVAMQLTVSSRREALDLTGDDSFYPGTDTLYDDYEGDGDDCGYGNDM